MANDNSNIAPTPPAAGYDTGYNVAPHINPSYNDANTSVQQQPPTNNYTTPKSSNYNHDKSTPVAPAGATANIDTTTTSSASGVTISPQVSDKAQKFCRFAISALQYEDTPTAIDNLQKALRLLQTGKL